MSQPTRPAPAGDVIVVPGAYPGGTNHFAHAGQPADPDRAAEYDATYGDLRDQMADRLTALFPAGRTVEEVADAIVDAVALPAGQRPFRIGIADLLTAHASR